MQTTFKFFWTVANVEKHDNAGMQGERGPGAALIESS